MNLAEPNFPASHQNWWQDQAVAEGFRGRCESAEAVRAGGEDAGGAESSECADRVRWPTV